MTTGPTRTYAAWKLSVKTPTSRARIAYVLRGDAIIAAHPLSIALRRFTGIAFVAHTTCSTSFDVCKDAREYTFR